MTHKKALSHRLVVKVTIKKATSLVLSLTFSEHVIHELVWGSLTPPDNVEGNKKLRSRNVKKIFISALQWGKNPLNKV